MTELSAFRPPRPRGILFNSVIILVLGATCAFAFFYGINQKVGGYFVLLLLISLLLFAPLPWVIYRTYALVRASYHLERDGLRLRWGLRVEDIPLPEVEWVRLATDLASNLALPRLSWPGALLGIVNVPDFGPVEYLASTTETLVLIATPRRVYAISPEDPQAFLRAFQRTFEMGSLAPLSSVSVLPAAYLSQVWSNTLARSLLMSGFLLNLFLFIGVSLMMPSWVAAPIKPTQESASSLSITQLLLLPILGAFLYVLDLTIGLFFYREEQDRLVAYLTWGSSVATAALLIGAVIILLSSR